MITISNVTPRSLRRGRPDGKPVDGARLLCSMRAMRRLFSPPITLADVARATKISIPTLSRIERGGSVSVEQALVLAKFYEKPVEEIWKMRLSESATTDASLT
jgi:hypothetical protein